MGQTIEICDLCRRVIPKGNPYVSICRSIEYIDQNPPFNKDEVEVVSDEQLLIFCSHCGNRFDFQSLIKIAKILPLIGDEGRN